MKTIVYIMPDGSRKEVQADSQGKQIGVGDIIKQVTGFLGIKQCPGCKKRQKELNRFKFKI